MNFEWSLIIDFGIIAIALALATFIRSKVRFFQSFLVPNSIVAGFLVLPFYNWLAPLFGISQSGLQNIVFHLLNLTFIALALRPASPRDGVSRAVIGTATIIISQLTFQALIGLGLTFLFIIIPQLPNLFPNYGAIVTLGFSLGPGQAFSIGLGWEELGFSEAGGLGLIFGAIGFIIACFGGVVLINLGVRRGYIKFDPAEISLRRSQTGLLKRGEKRPVGMRLTTRAEAIDTLSFKMMAVFVVYFLTYLLLKLITGILMPVGGVVAQVAESFWGIMFVFGLIVALIIKWVLGKAKLDHLLDTGGLTRISGTTVDFMVVAALGAISLAVIRTNWMPILVFSVFISIVTALTILWMCSRMFQDDFAFERAIVFWGALTGTLSTGLALLRSIDPELKTPAARDYIYASAITFFFVLPLVFTMGFPALAVDSGNNTLILIYLAVLVFYFLMVLIGFRLLNRKHKIFSYQIWYKSNQ